MAKKKNSSYRNYSNYLKGKEQLSNAILQHPDEPDNDSSMYSYMKGKSNNYYYDHLNEIVEDINIL